MLSIQAREYYKFTIDKLGEFEEEIDDLTKVGEDMQLQQASLISAILNSQNDQNKRLNAANTFNSSFNVGINSFKQNFKSLDFILKYKEIENSIQAYIDEEGIVAPEIEELFASFDNFRVKLQEFQQNDNVASAKVALYTVIVKICNDYSKITDSYSWFVKNLEETPYEFDETKHMILGIQLLGVDFGVSEFAERILAISDIYEHVSAIVPRDEGYEIEPMKIVKIESGSMDFSALGDSIIVSAISALIVGFVKAMITYFKKNKVPMPESEKDTFLDEMLNEISSAKGNAKHKIMIKRKIIDLTSKFFTIKINKEVYAYQGDDISALPFFKNQLLDEGSERNEGE